MKNKFAFSLCAALLLSACASERVILLPSSDGRSSAVVVRDARGGEVVLDRPYAATVGGPGGNRPYQADAEQTQTRYAPVLQARPPVPFSFTLYFESGSDRLTPESRAQFARIKHEVTARPAPEVMVIGHTDRVGTRADNDALSMQRAQTMRDLLVAEGLLGGKIEVAGRGERELLVPTADEVEEPRNRRVEVNIR